MASVQSSIFSNANIKKIQHQRYRLSVIDSINFRENWLIFLGIWGEAEVILGIWGAKEKKFQGAKVLSFRELGRSMHYFQGSREHRPPWGGLILNRILIANKQELWKTVRNMKMRQFFRVCTVCHD